MKTPSENQKNPQATPELIVKLTNEVSVASRNNISDIRNITAKANILALRTC